MKKHFRLLMAALLMGSVAFFSACSDDDDDDDNPTPTSAPTVTFKSGDGYTSEDATVDQGAMVKVGIVAEQSGAELSKLTIIKTVDGAAATVVDSTITGTTFTMDYEFAMGAADESWTFTVSNSKGMTADKVLKLTVNVQTPFAYENTEDGVLSHRWGQYPGAFDLVANAQLSESEPNENKDMENTSENGATFSATWKAGEGNTTTFIKAEGYDYDNATVETAAAEFAAGDPGAEITDAAVAGDVYIAKLRGTDEYAVIKINEVSETDKSGTGYIDFKYKKSSPTAGQ